MEKIEQHVHVENSASENLSIIEKRKSSFVNHATTELSNNWVTEVDWSKTALLKLPACASKYHYCTKLNLSNNQLEGSILIKLLQCLNMFNTFDIFNLKVA